jgi:hypothetical protein
MRSLKSITHSLCFVALAFCSVLFFFPSCRKDGARIVCLTCRATYSTGMSAGIREDLCDDEAQRKFRDEFRYVEAEGGKIECK